MQLIQKKYIPNFLTIFRIVLGLVSVLFFILNFKLIKYVGHIYTINFWKIKSNVNKYSILCLFFAATAIYTDYLDGHLSKKWKVESNFGRVYDPVADKIMTVSFLLCFIYFQITFCVLPLLLIARDLVMDMHRIFLSKKNLIIPAYKMAKIKTFSLMTSILLFIIFFNNSPTGDSVDNVVYYCLTSIVLLPSTVLSYISFFRYMKVIYCGSKQNEQPQ